MKKVTLNRRSFFQLATAAGAVIATPDSIAEAKPATFQAPVGIVMPWAGEAPPDGWMAADGRALPTADYPDLFRLVGYNYGRVGNDFRLPDLAGKSIEGWANELVTRPSAQIILVEPIEVELAA